MRATILVIDSFGIGALPDAVHYGDEGSNTALHLCEAIDGAKWPVLRSLGLGNAASVLGFRLPGCEAVHAPRASYGAMDEASPGKDTTTGHWELAGIHLDKPFHTFPEEYPSFPAELVKELEERIGRGILGNKAASGTVIIQELGDEHMRTGKPICYTSADSVFQIAAHEEVIPPEELYRICKAAREICDRYNVARVIARPFVTGEREFVRTKRRKDFSIPLPEPSLLDLAQEQGVHTIGVGKIGNIFAEQGLTESFPDKGNPACLERTAKLLQKPARDREIVFVNLVDTDMVYGHRRDVEGYFQAVADVDAAIGGMLGFVGDEDSFIVTADHGCDPTFRGTDHTREYVPFLWYQPSRPAVSVGSRDSHADVAAGIAHDMGILGLQHGGSPFP
jgi:phosphopentomutase